MRYLIIPVPKPRQTRSDKWKQRSCVMRYRAFADECRLFDINVINGCKIVFEIPMPKSWSKKKKKLMDGKPHTQRPDIDNLLKALMDATLPEDSHIHFLDGVKKIWRNNGCIEITKSSQID